MANYTIMAWGMATAGEQKITFRHVVTDYIYVANITSNYLSQIINQFISTYAKRIDF